MKENEFIRVEGKVIGIFGYSFDIEIQNGVVIKKCLRSGKMCKNKIKLVLADKVAVELSQYDLHRGRITRRL